MNPERRSLWPLLPLLAVYVLLRYWRARYPGFFEYDEYFYFHWARFSWTEVMEAMRVDVWPPLSGLIFKPVIQFADYSPVLPRCLAIAFGALSMSYLYVFAQPRFGIRAALCMAGLLVVSPLDVTWTALSRGYSLFMLGMTVLTVHAYLALERRVALDWILIVISSIVLLYTHFLAGFILVSLWLLLGICFLIRRDWASLGLLFLAGVALTVAFLPYLPTFLNQLECGANMRLKDFYSQSSPWAFGLEALNAQAGGRVALALLTLAGMLAFALANTPPTPQEKRWWKTAIGVFVCASVMAYFYHTFKRPMFKPGKQAILFHGPLMLCLGILMARIRVRWVAAAVLCLLLINTVRIMHDTHNRLPDPNQDAPVIEELTTALRGNSHLYFGNLTRIRSFTAMARQLDPKLMIRDFSNFRCDYIPVVLPQFIYRDLNTAPVALWMQVDDEDSAALQQWLLSDALLKTCALRRVRVESVPGSELWIFSAPG